MSRKRNSFLVCTALLSLLLAAEPPADADVVTDWNMAALDVLKAKNVPNQFANRTLAILHLAMYDSINWGRKAPRFPSELAAASAAYTVAAALQPDPAFDALYAAHLSQFEHHRLRQSAIQYGRLVARSLLKWRADDGSAEAASVPFPDGTEIGQWRRTDDKPPMLPGWGSVAPFLLLGTDQFRLIGPLDLTGWEYARDYNEVKELGAANSAVRTAEQSVIARFWISGIPRMWNLVAHQVSEDRGLGSLENARLFAMLNVALADANVVAWDMKYHYGFWRPVTAIAFGDEDGNDWTAGDASWRSMIPAPPFPEYVSGHSTACSAAATVLAKFIGTDAFTFTLASEANPSLPPRTFTSFWAAAREAGISRIYGGIHFNFSNTEGLEAGRSLGRYVSENFR